MDDFVTLGSLFETALKHRLKILIAFILSVLAAVALNALAVPMYEASSTLFIKFGRENIYLPEVGDRSTLVTRDRPADFNTEIEILRSRDLHERVVSAVGPARLYPELAEAEESARSSMAAGRFGGNLSVTPKADTYVIKIAFKHPEPATAAEAVNVVVDFFREKHLETFGDSQATVFLEAKVAGYRERLDELELRLENFQTKNRFISSDDQRASLLRERSRLDAERNDAQNQVAGLRQKVAFLESLPGLGNRQREDAAGDLTGDSAISDTMPYEQAQQVRAIDEAHGRLLQLELKKRELLSQFADTSRTVANVDEQIALVENFLAQQEAKVRPGLQTDLVRTHADMRFQEARLDTLLEQRRQLTVVLSRLPELERQYRGLVRERDTLDQHYQSYTDRLETGRVAEEMDLRQIANIRVIQEAFVPRAPVSPRKQLNLAVGIVIGLALGFGWAFLSESILGNRGEDAQARRERRDATGDFEPELGENQPQERPPVTRATLSAEGEQEESADSEPSYLRISKPPS